MGKEELQDLELLGKLRECLDPSCAEYKWSSMEQKIEILRKIKSKKEWSMFQILMEYKDRYEDEGKPYVLDDLPNGLAAIVDYLLQK